jgi:hypothetical protein
LLLQDHFLSTENQTSAAGTQETKEDSTETSPDKAGSMCEGASTSREEVMEVKNASENQTEASANGESHLFVWLIMYSIMHD